uniref:Unclassified n=4 Tax=Fusarium pseudograminearum TaxID=101028 RepID=W1IBN7_FUSPS|nr:unclassified [Fusarium pseudograminearum CS3220]CDL73086.1 unclassified [Fusarium pseudograminearum CS3427]CDL73170.1 unclassified [Fusarium pseudograminearum CS3487]CDL73264.1 unclassified [Fusarium pseudograminearum CS5834]CDX48202.1 unclassified [Fusarium pseudograminearum CS5834]
MWGTPHHSVDHGVGGPPGGYALFFFIPGALLFVSPMQVSHLLLLITKQLHYFYANQALATIC